MNKNQINSILISVVCKSRAVNDHLTLVCLKKKTSNPFTGNIGDSFIFHVCKISKRSGQISKGSKNKNNPNVHSNSSQSQAQRPWISVVQAGNVIPARANIMYNTVQNEHQVSYEQAKPRTNKEKSSFPHLRRITHLSDVMQPPTNRKNGAQIAHDMKKILKEFHCHFI